MDVTLLGSGDALGVPAPLCDCEYCRTSERRRRPGLLVEMAGATVVLDVSPDVKEQLHAIEMPDVNAFFVTHHHFDHAGGLHELNHAAMAFDEHMLNPGAVASDERPRKASFEVFLTPTACLHLNYSNAHVAKHLDLNLLAHGDAVRVGDMRVVPFPVDHGRPMFDTLGFAVYHDDAKVVYAPDVRGFLPDREAGREYENADLLFAEGVALFRAEGHGSEAELRSALESASADRTVLVNCNEHFQRMSTAELRAAAADTEYELGRDFAEYQL